MFASGYDRGMDFAPVRARRLELGMSQTDLARRTGLSQPYINELERSRKINPSFAVILALAEALDTTPRRLVHLQSDDGG